MTSSRKRGLGRPPLSLGALALLLLSELVFLSIIPVGEATGTGGDGASLPRSSDVGRIIVVSNETNILVAQGGEGGTLRAFPDRWDDRRVMEVSGQLVDGNFTPIWQDPSHNRGIGTSPVLWSFGDDGPRAHTVVTDDQGFFHFLLVPEVIGPQTLELSLWFDGYTDPTLGIELYPPAVDTYRVAIVVPSSIGLTVSQERPLAGTTILIWGDLTDRDGDPIPSEGLVATLDGEPVMAQPKAGLYIDDVTVTGDWRTVHSTGFEAGWEGWTHEGTGDEWEVGIPAGDGLGPAPRAGGPSCAGTDLDGGYEYASDAWLLSPDINLGDVQDSSISFWMWVDIEDGDIVVLRLSNDAGVTWPVTESIAVTGRVGKWTLVSVPLIPRDTDAYGMIAFSGETSFRFAIGLVSQARPIVTDGEGRFELEVPVPGSTGIGDHTLTVRHPVSGLYMESTRSVVIDVIRSTMVSFDGPMELFRGEPVEVDARLIDISGKALEVTIDGISQWYSVEASYSDPRGGADPRYIFIQDVPVAQDGHIAFAFEPGPDVELGPVNVHIAFKGSSNYMPITAVGSLTLRAHTTVDLFSPLMAEQWKADDLNVSGRLSVARRESLNVARGDPVQGRTMDIYLSGRFVGTAKTDADGRFSAMVPRSGAWSGTQGSTGLEAGFAGDPIYVGSSTGVDLALFKGTFIPFVAPATFVRVGEGGYVGDAVFEGALVAKEDGIAIDGAEVTLAIDDGNAARTVTDDQGSFRFRVRPDPGLPLGRHAVAISFAGDTRYLMTNITTTINIIAETRLAMYGPSAAHVGEAIDLKGTLYEGAGGWWRPIPMERVSVPNGGPALITGPDGEFAFTMVADLAGTFHVLTLHGSDFRLPSNATVQVKVTAEPWFEPVPGAKSLLEGETAQLYFVVHGRGAFVEGLRASIEISGGKGGDLLLSATAGPDGALAVNFTPGPSGTYDVQIWSEANDTLDAAGAQFDIYIGPPARPGVAQFNEPDKTALVTVSAITVLLAMLLATGQGAKFMFFQVFLVPLYTKLKKDEVLDHFMRGQIYGLIRMHPGAHYNLIKKRLDLKNGVLAYHLTTLEREGYVISEKDGIFKRFYPNHMKFEVDYPAMLSRVQEKILDWIKVNPGRTQKECATALGVSTSTVNDNVIALRDYKMLELKKDGKRTRCYILEGGEDAGLGDGAGSSA